jgi:hypothetical protein
MRRLLACLALVFAAGPAAACINDAELPGAEREFRSQYKDGSPKPAASPDPDKPLRTSLLAGAGTALVVVAFGLVVNGRRTRS